jgi:hypothetical protein
MSRRRGRVIKEVAPTQLKLADLDEGDSDYPDQTPYDFAVACVLEALEGLWFESSDVILERDVNDHVQKIKRQIQETL